MIHRSRFPAIDLPHTDVVSYIMEHAPERGTRPALVDAATGRTLTYRELSELVGPVATGLARTGLVPGDVLALHAPNSLLYPVICLAAMAAGAAVTPVNAMATEAELVRQLQSSGARRLVCAAQLLPLARAATAAGALDEILLVEKPPHDGPDPGDLVGLRDIADLRDLGRAADPGSAGTAAAGVSPPAARTCDPTHDVALLPYSSGTSGPPKGVLLTHAGLTANIAQMAHAMQVGPGHRVLAVLPFFHAYGFTTLIGLSLRCGATLVVVDRFRGETFLQTLTGHRVTHALIAPPLALALVKNPATHPAALASVQQILSSAAPLDAGLAARTEQCTGVPVVQAYGMTEMSPGIAVPPPGEQPPPGSVGRLLPLTEMRVVSLDDGRDLGVGEEGELWVRGPQLMKGYARPDGTAALPADAAAALPADAAALPADGAGPRSAGGSGDTARQEAASGGWLRTGDIGVIDKEGWLRLIDRAKDLIKYKGYQISPAELEGLLLDHPLVADAAVAGAVDEDGMEYPAAYVVLAPGAGDPEAAGARLTEHVAARVAPYKKIRAVRFVGAIPRSSAGKVLRRELGRPGAGGPAGAGAMEQEAGT